ncbi:hypothetical protein J0K78_11010 [Halobacillus sp. GSS1]|uniref:CsxC family protein n=1 Tax=Halobacillus sp. GSS1 TaxID=2815919 RepID=UPI001A8E400B|nr:hypothetical protein [Halobacillus sp. GSS1]MBN9654795.1 hypothetical protein [Halobacillus sp. GSS1]
MKKNTGCGNGYGHGKKCPPLSSDVAKSKSLFTASEEFSSDDMEQTVILGDVLIQSLTEADFELPSYARAIKNIEKNVSLTQCKAIPVVGNPGYVKLFVEGVVHKNIQYVEDGYGYVKDYSIDIPFKAYDQVQLANPVDYPFGFEYSIKENVLQRRELAKGGMGANRCEFGSLTFEINNEPIKCKLLASAVNQWDIVHHFDNWGRFNKVTEKMDINLVIKLTQKQQPNFTPPSVPPMDNGDNGGEDSAQASTTQQQETVYSRFRKIIGQ